MKIIWGLAVLCSLSSCYVYEDNYIPADTEIADLFPDRYQTGDTIRFEMGYFSFDTFNFVVQEKNTYLTRHSQLWNTGFREVQQLRLEGEGSIGDIVITIGGYRKEHNYYSDTFRVLEIKCPQNGYGAQELDSMSRSIDTVNYRKKFGASDFYLDYSTYAGIIKFRDYRNDIQLTQVP